jgi:hypothetical protein
MCALQRDAVLQRHAVLRSSAGGSRVESNAGGADFTVSPRTHTPTHTRTHTHTHTRARMHARAHTHTPAHARFTHIHTHTVAHTHTHTCARARTDGFAAVVVDVAMDAGSCLVQTTRQGCLGSGFLHSARAKDFTAFAPRWTTLRWAATPTLHRARRGAPRRFPHRSLLVRRLIASCFELWG